MNVKDITKAREQLAKMPPRPWTNPWEENEDGEAEAIRDAEGKVVIGLGYYDGYHLEVGIEVCQIILAIINTLYPAALATLEEAWEQNSRLRLAVQTALNCLNYEGSYYETRCHQVQGLLNQALRAAEEKQGE